MKFRFVPLCSSLCLLVLLVGCGSKETLQLSGKVTLADGTAPKAPVKFIRLEPTESSTATVRKAAACELAEDGTFTLFTRKPGDGVYRGQYKVTFSICTDTTCTKSLVDLKYKYPAETPFELDVTADRSDLEFKLDPAE